MGSSDSATKSRSSSSSGSHFFDFAKDGVRVTGQMLIGACVAGSIALFSAGVAWTRIETRVSSLEVAQAKNTEKIEQLQDVVAKLVERVDLLIRIKASAAPPRERRQLEQAAHEAGVEGF